MIIKRIVKRVNQAMSKALPPEYHYYEVYTYKNKEGKNNKSVEICLIEYLRIKENNKLMIYKKSAAEIRQDKQSKLDRKLNKPEEA